MSRSQFGALINYAKIKIKNIKIPSVRFVDPSKLDPEPPIDMSFQDGYMIISCPKCKEKYVVPPYTVDFTCNSRPDGEGCKRNRFKYYDYVNKRYKEEYRPYDFDIDEV